ncbi:CHAP domain-containing protein [Nocardia abscessus]|uniref:CHAP domain-containing protein n=1 Tax=Nocardia TaxID=1817 RepID=UPI001895474C|nr:MULTISPECIES: CHAP domain-containing protein [Nocardia]MBF6217228.1 CHAP domain-containing protein [Nocardia abscessus]MDE1670774.1 CHAP domain-containing protein [Nocardia gipuzkoensis]
MTRQVGVRPGRWIAFAVVVLCVAAAGIAGGLWWQDRADHRAVVGERLTEFPALDRSALDAAQAGIVAVAEREFADPGAGTKYAEGVEEAWCADFVSWVLREAGAPLANPNSGSWRIPGVYTLQEYYESVGRFVPAGSGYRPRTGDVLLYRESSPFGQHTNIVLLADAGQVTTIGGNEYGEVRIHRFALDDVPGVVGFGRL